MTGRISRGVGQGIALALRSSAAPLLVGMHLAGRRGEDRHPDAPPPRWDLRLISKAALDEFFFATEIASASFFSLRDRRRVVREIGSAARLYERKGWLRAPSRYHRRPPEVEKVSIDEHRSAFGPFHPVRFDAIV